MKIKMKKRVVQFLLVIMGYFMGWKMGISLRSSPWRRICHTSVVVSLSQSQHVHTREFESSTLNTVVIGVMTSWKSLVPRASAILDTWGREVADQILFYVGHDGNKSADARNTTGSDDAPVPPGSEPISIIRGLPVVELTDVDDVISPTRQKSIAILRHMHQHFGLHSRWFVRVEDEVYIHYKKLTKFLLSLDDSLPWYIGGKRQRLHGSPPHCQERPSIVFSSTSLRLLHPHLPQCQAAAKASQEDFELGRCVRRHLNLPCSTDKKIQALFLQPISTQHPDKKKASWATKEQQLMWDVHQAAQRLQLRNLQSRMEELDEERREMDSMAVDTGLPGHVTAHGGRPRDHGGRNDETVVSRFVERGKPVVAMETEGRRKAHIDPERGARRDMETEGRRKAHIDPERGARRDMETEGRRKAHIDPERGARRDMETEGRRKAHIDPERGARRDMETEGRRKAHIDPERGARRDVREEAAWHRVNVNWWSAESVRYNKFTLRTLIHLCKVSSEFNRALSESLHRFSALPLRDSFLLRLIRRVLQRRHRSVVVFRRLSVSKGMQHLVVVSTSVGSQSFRVQTTLGEMTWREDFHDGMWVPSNGIPKYSALQSQFRKNKDVPFKPHQKLGNNLINSPPNVLKPSLPTLHILLPLKGRHQKFLQFLENLDKATGMYGGDVYLHVALFQESDEETELSSYITERKSGLSSSVFVLQGKFHKTVAFNALSVLFDNSSILVLMDVDMVLTDQFLYRVAFNVGPNTAYAPIVFSTYSPDTVCYGQPRCSPSPFDFSKDAGLWRDFGYGMIALRAEDYRKCGGMDNTIIGWGNEDTDFAARCIRRRINIIRARDPGLTHVYHEKVCDPHLPRAQKSNCYSSKNIMYGSEGKLAQMMMDVEKKRGNQ